jgi:hypothetical protein
MQVTKLVQVPQVIANVPVVGIKSSILAEILVTIENVQNAELR